METTTVPISLMKSTVLVIVRVSRSARMDNVFRVPSAVMEIMTAKMAVMKKTALSTKVTHAKMVILSVCWRAALNHAPMTPTVKYLKTKPTAVNVNQ